MVTKLLYFDNLFKLLQKKLALLCKDDFLLTNFLSSGQLEMDAKE